jgi:hypothetical protein
MPDEHVGDEHVGAYDIVGDGEHVGDTIGDHSDGVGQMPAWLSQFLARFGPQATRPAAPPPRAPHRLAQQGSKQLFDRIQAHALRRQIAPIPATPIAPGATANISIRPQRAIRVQRLVLQSTVSPSQLLITDITVGARPQFVNAGAVPVGVFAANAFDVELRGDTASPGIEITLTVTNPSAAAETLAGAIIGEALEV